MLLNSALMGIMNKLFKIKLDQLKHKYTLFFSYFIDKSNNDDKDNDELILMKKVLSLYFCAYLFVEM